MICHTFTSGICGSTFVDTAGERGAGLLMNGFVVVTGYFGVSGYFADGIADYVGWVIVSFGGRGRGTEWKRKMGKGCLLFPGGGGVERAPSWVGEV